MGRRVPRKAWLGSQSSMGLLIYSIRMDLMFVKSHLPRGLLMRRLVLRTSMLVLAVMAVSLMQVTREVRVPEQITLDADECPFDLDSNPNFNLTEFLNSAASSFALPLFMAPAGGDGTENLTRTVFQALMDKNLLRSDAAALCVGEKSSSAVLALRHLGFFNAVGADRHPYFSLFKRGFVYELNYEDNHFDFVFSEDLDRVSVPGLLVRELERVLRPGGTGAILLGSGSRLYSSAALWRVVSITSFLTSSDVQHICRLGSLNLIIFKKRLGSFASFEHFQLPSACPAVENNKKMMKYIEPIADEVSPYELSYLPNYMNISSRNKLVYINVGAGEYARPTIEKLSKPYCGDHHTAFEVFIIDHKTSVLSSYVTEPSIHFVYHPALAGDVSGNGVPEVSADEFLSAPVDEGGFEFVPWFKETVSDGDFVVLMMNAKFGEMNILVDLFKSGEICRVDELFLKCSEECKRDCANIFGSLRKSGVYAHQCSDGFNFRSRASLQFGCVGNSEFLLMHKRSMRRFIALREMLFYEHIVEDPNDSPTFSGRIFKEDLRTDDLLVRVTTLSLRSEE
ncbi:uncharacterized protein LOC127239269 [Andrographis paniculata]|uniref:uncharacterized protein LOC127239269 n=1 Tax=Andrographis paniculata TaxID=175694 RepID=UPI0021E8EABF|nr:uncharacterized protein LOC127239269 [Andrographis paniculata]